MSVVSSNMEKWVCPNDRQLLLRAKIGAGWSFHSSRPRTRDEKLSTEEQDHIIRVIRRNEMIEEVEQRRVGTLVDRLENMKRLANGNGTTECVLCGMEFGMLTSTSVHCEDCSQSVCSQCSVDTINKRKQQIWLCKICSEHRELWKRSGAWFYKSLPKYVLPDRRADLGRAGAASRHATAPHLKTTWTRVNAPRELSGEQESSEDDDDIQLGRRKVETESEGTHSSLGERTFSGGDTSLRSLGSSPRGTSTPIKADHLPVILVEPQTAVSTSPNRELDNKEICAHPTDSSSSATSATLSATEEQPDTSSSPSHVSSKSFSAMYPSTQYEPSTHQLLSKQVLSAVPERDNSSVSDIVHLTTKFQASASRARSKPASITEDSTQAKALASSTYSVPPSSAPLASSSNPRADSDEANLVEISSSAPQSDRPVNVTVNIALHHDTPAQLLNQEDAGQQARSQVQTPLSEYGGLTFSLKYNSKLCELHMHIISATSLKTMDINGYSDPYVKCHLLPSIKQKTKLRTRTIKKTLNPVWNEGLVYYGITEDDIQQKTLRLAVLDEDIFGFDFLGVYQYPLRGLVPDEQMDFTVGLLDWQKEPNAEDDLNESKSGKILLGLYYDGALKRLKVTVIRCAELAPKDINGYSDPYVKLYLLPDKSKKSKQKTKIKKKNLNPEFNEVFTFTIDPSEADTKSLEITVWDYDRTSANDLIGGLCLGANAKGERLRVWQDLFQNPNAQRDVWFNLSQEVKDKEI